MERVGDSFIMPDQEINIAIAEACGWKFERDNGGPYHMAGHHIVKDGHKRGFKSDSQSWESVRLIFQIPDYCHDLNAMNEAEKELDRIGKWLQYVHTLAEVTTPEKNNEYCSTLNWPTVWLFVHSTARQRAEAFLRTIGKWKD